jgi:hypothetical protein
MDAPCRLASHSSVYPIKSSPPINCLMRDLYKSHQTPSKVTNPEDGNCKVWRNTGKTSASDSLAPKAKATHWIHIHGVYYHYTYHNKAVFINSLADTLQLQCQLRSINVDLQINFKWINLTYGSTHITVIPCIMDLRFSPQWLWRHVVHLKSSDILEKYVTSNLRVEEKSSKKPVWKQALLDNCFMLVSCLAYSLTLMMEVT